MLAVTPYYVYCYTLMERQRIKGLRGAAGRTRDRRAQKVQRAGRHRFPVKVPYRNRSVDRILPHISTAVELCGNRIIA